MHSVYTTKTNERAEQEIVIMALRLTSSLLKCANGQSLQQVTIGGRVYGGRLLLLLIEFRVHQQ